MKKKLITTITALTLCLSMSATVFATGASINQASDPKTGTTTITTTTDPTYTVTIPADTQITFGDTSTDLDSVALESARLESGYVVTVSAEAGAFVNDDDDSESIAYTLEDTDGVFTSATFSAAGESKALTIEIEQDAWDNASAGSYTGTITFTVAYGAAATE